VTPARPRWSDVAAVRARVDEEIAELRSEVSRRDAIFPTPSPLDGAPDFEAVAAMMQDEIYADWPPDTEHAAVAAALRGDTKPLADMVRPIPHGGLIPDDVNPMVKRLSVDAWALIAQLLAGERNLRTGRLKGQPGRPRMSRADRRARNPAHAAVAEVPAIRAILRRLYPERSTGEVSVRADEVARLRAGTVASVTILRRRARRGRHRA
jgi:hypothetical protein